MIDFILSQLTSWAGWAVAALGGLAAILIQRWRNRRLQEKLEQQDRAISTYKAKEEINRHDQEADTVTDKQISDLRRRVDNAESPEEKAGAVSGALDEFFGRGMWQRLPRHPGDSE